MKHLIAIAVALLLGVPSFAQTHYREKIDIENEQFFNKLVNVQLDMQKDSVLSILGCPYKKAAIKTSNGIIYESISYRTDVFKKAVFRSKIIYSLIFRNSILIMINEDEHFSSEEIINRQQGVDLWTIAKNYEDSK
jgi:hypothetical protein